MQISVELFLLNKPFTYPIFHQKHFKIGITLNTYDLLQFKDSDTMENAGCLYDIIS